MCEEIIQIDSEKERVGAYLKICQIVNCDYAESYLVHNCMNGDLGIAELQGMKYNV